MDIHFIWAGGTFPMQSGGIATVSDWINKNTQHTVNLWIDVKTAGDFAELHRYYSEMFGSEGVRVLTDEEYQHAIESGATHESLGKFIVLKDIEQYGFRDEHVAYEIEKIRPNYGASSDLLRYQILERLGGAYFDSDVSPGDSTLPTTLPTNENVLYIEHCPQQVTAEKLGVMSLNTPGNDTFICNAHNPIMNQLILESHSRYDVGSSMNEIIYNAHSGRIMQDFTVKRTGPICVRDVLASVQPEVKENSYWDTPGPNANKIYRVRDGNSLSLATPQANTGNWLKSKITRFSSRAAAIEAIRQTMQFELRHQQCLRLDDHIEDLIASLEGIENITPQEALSALAPSIQALTPQPVYTQVTGLYKESVDFCRRAELMCLFVQTDPNVICNAILRQLNAGIFLNIEKISSERSIAESVILRGQRTEVKEQLCRQVISGVETTLAIYKNIKSFNPEVQNEVMKYLHKRLQKYIEHGDSLDAFNGQTLDAVKQKAKIGMSVMNTILSKAALVSEQQIEHESKLGSQFTNYRK